MRYIGPTEEVRQSFHQGTNRRAYEMLGAHPVEQEGKDYWHFAVWAPNARAVSLIGEFNAWNREATPMVKQHDGTWEILFTHFIPLAVYSALFVFVYYYLVGFIIKATSNTDGARQTYIR